MDKSSLDPISLLSRVAYQNCPELYVSSARPRRLRGKSRHYTLGQMLFKLQADPAHPRLGVGNSIERKCEKVDAGVSRQGWRWLPSVNKVSRKELKLGPWTPAVLHLFDSIVFCDRDLLTCEDQAIKAFHRIHEESGQIRLLDVPRVCTLLGADNLPVSRAIGHILPCIGHIWATTGTACDASDPSSQCCGGQR